MERKNPRRETLPGEERPLLSVTARCAVLYRSFFFSLLVGAAFHSAALGQTNILPPGTLESFGSEKNSADKAAANVYDELISTRWESQRPMMREYFIFSFAGLGTYSFSSLHLYNLNDKKAVKHFQLFYSSDDAARTDPDDSSWQPIAPSGSFVTEKMNLLNVRLGAKIESFGSEKDSDHSASHLADGSTKTKWESEQGSSNDYFIFSFQGESTETPDSFVLFNDKNKGVKQFKIYYSTDPAVKNDPDHSSWVQINGTYTANKTQDPQSYTFSQVSARYFLLKVTDQYDAQKVKIMEMELYGTKTLGGGNVWKAQQATGEQTFSFSQVSGKYFMFLVGSNYDDDKTSLYELELLGSQGGLQVLKWREVIH